MIDGRVVQFPGTRQVDKTVEVDAANGTWKVRFDFRNGETRSISSTELDNETNLQAGGHGVSQKTGDSWASLKDPDDMVLKCDDMLERLRKGEWFQPSEAGDSMAGAGIVIKAIMEVTGRDVGFVKKYLQGLLDSAKTRGEKLSRQELYAGFRGMNTPTGPIIKRLEEEKLQGFVSKVNVNDMLAGMIDEGEDQAA